MRMRNESQFIVKRAVMVLSEIRIAGSRGLNTFKMVLDKFIKGIR